MGVVSLSPFAPHWFDRGGGARMHYVDEGQGAPVVMVHGNPTWSFYYRELAGALKDSCRVIVPDHVGCGLSDKPQDYPYTLKQRVDDLEALLEHLGIVKDITLIVHDWGGMIGMAWASRHPERVRRLVILNTGAFHLPEDKPFPWQLWLCRTPLGPLLVRGCNMFCLAAARLCAVRRPLSAAARAGYLAPYDSWANRVAVLRFVQDIPLTESDAAYAIVTGVEQGLHRFRGVPTLICWGLRDFIFDASFLRVWRKHLPGAEVHTFADGGHYILEDAGPEIISLVGDFMRRYPVDKAAPAP
ncbi:MAG: alpha/beta fold hydrolase [Elusimicrobiota bacterium]